MSRRIRTYRQVADAKAENVIAQVVEQNTRLADRLSSVRQIAVIASGKGGVGKSALTANLAAALSDGGARVGAADADLNGPSLARMLGAHDQRLRVTEDGLDPATGAAGVRVMSMDLLLPSDDAPLRWRSPEAPAFLWQSTLEGGVLREFLADVRWGELDYLLIDAPPGTDKLTRLLQLLPRAATILLVTTPSDISRFVVAKSARLAREATGARAADDAAGASGGATDRTGEPAIGLVVNMAAQVCEACGTRTPLFDDEGGRPIEIDLPTWAEIPFDRRLALSTDRGAPFVLRHPEAPAARAILRLAERLGS